MCNDYNVQLDEKVVGIASVTREGLYLRIVCRCKFAEPGLYKVEAEGPVGTVNLGTCVQSCGVFGLDTRVPVKHLGIGEIIFRVRVPCREKGQILIPVSEGEPFDQIAQIRNARLKVLSGKYFIELKNDSYAS